MGDDDVTAADRIAELVAKLDAERLQWAEERRQYQARIVELSSRLGAPVQAEVEKVELARKRASEIRSALDQPGVAQGERNALALELQMLRPLLGADA